MSDGSVSKDKRHKKTPISESALRGFKYFKVLSPILERLHSENNHHNRELYFDRYIVLLLFYFFNPVITSLRAIQQVSGLKKAQKILGVKRTSLGSLSEAGNVRVVEIYHRGSSGRPRLSRVSSKKTFRTTDSDYVMLLVTDRMDLSAETIALIYRYRWQIELFFRWFKCILGCNHLLSLSENGVALQVYCALIASILITLWTDRKPTKRTFEMLCYHFMGWADDEELFNHLEKLQLSDNKMKTD